MQRGLRASLVWIAIVAPLAAGVAFSTFAPPPATAAPVPIPLLWQRQYVPPGGQIPSADFAQVIQPQCAEDIARGTRSNGVTGPGIPKIAVVGDSTEVQMRQPAMADTAINWQYATHCGEQMDSLVEQGRLSDALAIDPDVLVFGVGTNDLQYYWQVWADRLPTIIDRLWRMIEASDAARCRVLVNLAVAPPVWATGDAALTWMWLAQKVNEEMAWAAATRPNLLVADFAGRIASEPSAYLQDGQHHTPTGVNARLNLEIETARRCWAPDSPTGVGATALDRAATVWWNPLPAPEAVTQYRVTVSPGGRTVLTDQPTLNIGGLTNGVPTSFRVEAISPAGVSDPSGWTTAVTPSPAGARFHPSSPARVLDTRVGLGGKGGPFWPGESFELQLGAAVPAGASAVVLNVTATGQTADTFVTVWPGQQSRPLVSNLNPRPGVLAVPAMVTSRVSPSGSVRLFNNAGFVDLIADVIGWYGPAGDSTGALYSPVTPQRLLDTRDGTGGKAAPFSGGETFALPVLQPGMPTDASAVVLNITTTSTSAPTHVTVWPTGAARPMASSLNPQPGITRANLTTAAIGNGGKVSLFNNAGSTNLIVDLVGYYTSAGAASGGSPFFPATPERAYDTRDGTGGVRGPLSGSVVLPFAGRGVVPPDASAVDVNVTAVDQPTPGHLTIWPAGQSLPIASNLNYGARDTIANRALAGLSGGNTQLAPAPASASQVVMDVAGWFGPRL